MRTIKYILLGLCLLPSLALAAVHYVDADAVGAYAGTFANPFKTVAHVNGHTFYEGDDLYFEAGDTWVLTGSEQLTLNWDGNSGDQAEIGAYSAEGVFTLGGGAKPIFEGPNVTGVGPSSGTGLVYLGLDEESFDGYVTVENIEVTKSRGIGFFAMARIPGSGHTVTNCIFQNMNLHHNYNNGFQMTGVSYSLVEDIDIDYSPETNLRGSSFAIKGTLGGWFETGHHNMVRRVKTTNGGTEGISVYSFANNNTFEWCTSHNANNYNFYVNNSQNNTFKYCMSYNTLTGGKYNNNSRGFMIDNETHLGMVGLDTTGNEFIYCLAGGLDVGFGINNEAFYSDDPYYIATGAVSHDNKIIGCIAIDCIKNFTFPTAAADGTAVPSATNQYSMDGCEVINSVSILYGGFSHVRNPLAVEVTWTENFFSGDPGGNAGIGTNHINQTLIPAKTSGWRSIAGDTINGTEFILQPGSASIDNVTALVAAYKDAINPMRVNFSTWPITYGTLDQNDYGDGWDGGPFVFGTESSLAAYNIYPDGGGILPNVVASWSNPVGTNTIEYWYAVEGAALAKLADGTDRQYWHLNILPYNSSHKHRIDILHDGGTEIGRVVNFTIQADPTQGGEGTSTDTGNSGGGARATHGPGGKILSIR